jgi:hypothetical protein
MSTGSRPEIEVLQVREPYRTFSSFPGLSKIEDEKRKAEVELDLSLAAHLKREIDVLANLQAAKLAAIESEDYDIAAEIKRKIDTILVNGKGQRTASADDNAILAEGIQFSTKNRMAAYDSDGWSQGVHHHHSALRRDEPSPMIQTIHDRRIFPSIRPTPTGNLTGNNRPEFTSVESSRKHIHSFHELIAIKHGQMTTFQLQQKAYHKYQSRKQKKKRGNRNEPHNGPRPSQKSDSSSNEATFARSETDGERLTSFLKSAGQLFE